MLFIWGTNIHLTTLQARLRRFFSNFQPPGAEQPKYMELMSQARAFPGLDELQRAEGRADVEQRQPT